MYGEQDVLDDTLHKAMYDQTKVELETNSLTMTQSESITVFQVKRDHHEGPVSGKPSTDNNNNDYDAKDSRVSLSHKCCSICNVSSKHDCLAPQRKFVQRIVQSQTFEAFIIFIILVNTLFMSIYYHGINKDLARAIDIVNWVSRNL